jgi:hypothetical protein
MNKQLFDELIESIKEAGQIHRGEIRASREFVFDVGVVAVPDDEAQTKVSVPHYGAK